MAPACHALFNGTSTRQAYCSSIANGREGIRRPMIDNFSLGLSHGLMLLAAWLLLRRPDLDREPGPRDQTAKPRRLWGRDRA